MQNHPMVARIVFPLFLLLPFNLLAQKVEDRSLVGESYDVKKTAVSSPDWAAFTFQHYELAISIDASHSQIDTRGNIILQNASGKPQSSLILQVSSTLKWKSLQVNGEALQFVSTTIDSGTDHTGKINEMEAVLPHPVAPGAMLSVDVAYGGTIILNADRLRAIGAPGEASVHTDWDRITPDFTGLRGAGYVVWYPISIDPKPLDSSTIILEQAAAWRARHAQSSMHVVLHWSGEKLPRMVFANAPVVGETTVEHLDHKYSIQWKHLGMTAPVILAGDYDVTPCSAGNVYAWIGVSSRKASTTLYQDGCNKIASAIKDWTGHTPSGLQIIELPEIGDAPFDAGATFLTSFRGYDVPNIESQVVHAMSHAAVRSDFAWIEEGLAHYMQARVREMQDSAGTPHSFLSQRLSALIAAETEPTPETQNSLINSTSDIFLRTKAMYVWWMLYDMVGNKAMAKVLAAYDLSKDQTATTFQHVVENETKKDYAWFFNDWVYRDKGLPDLQIINVTPRDNLNGGWLVGVTVQNNGNAAVEVPVRILLKNSESSMRILVKAHDKTTIRISTAERPLEVIVNDGSVPESDYNNNRYVIPAKQP